MQVSMVSKSCNLVLRWCLQSISIVYLN